MPRVNLCKDKQTERENNKRIQEVMLIYRNRLGINRWSDAYQLCGFKCLGTFESRRKKPETFTVEELRLMTKGLKIPMDKIRPYL